ncbi:myc box-dependent-interacting protein 1-like isoform X2 [Amphibalanus amphitrite]|uniref:myc box-dependent-interacting protein 1-like isoform X2 n=1 Tax=Amphibalanus amphitrite TaxID=1232801 RepID=UPI001C924B5A|nr:myc box-dependent-interacting protein 1-like isoform X2 [Amphibalanus amphitrite]
MSTTRSQPQSGPNGNKASQSPPPSPLKMSEIKPEFIARSVRKHAGRAKERILQNLGKADRTTDEVFDDYVHNFGRQQGQANRLQKEMANYVRCAKAMQAANKSLMDTIYDMYEPEWSDRDRLERQARELELLWADYCHKLSDQVLEPLNTYSSQFPEVRRKVEKRGRKLVDYDSHRHNYEALQNNTKKRDQTKIAKQHEVLEEARRTFEVMNNELYDELPALYDSRIPFLVSNMQTLFMAENNFHTEAAKVQLELESVMDALQKDSNTGKYTTRRNVPKSPKSPTAPTPASPTGQDDVRLVRPGASAAGGSGGSAGIRQTLTALTKRLSVRHQERPPTRPTVARAATFHVSSPSTPHEPGAADGGDGAGPDTNPFRQPAAGASPHRQRRRHNPFLESPRPGAPTPPPPPIPSSPPPPYDSGEQILEVSPAPPPPPHAALTEAARSSEGDSPGAEQASPSPAAAEADRSPGEVAASARSSADGPALGAQTEPPPKPPRTPEAGEEPAERSAPVAEPEPSTVSGVYPSLPSVPETDASPPAARAGGSPAADADGSLDRNKSNREDPRPYEEISYKKENGDFNGDVPSGAARASLNGGAKVRPEELYDIPVGATTDNLPPGVLYRVKAAYKYQAEDADELSFEVAECIQVVEYDDQEEQEEGWLMGVKESTGQKGLFPANFTRPI